MPTGYTAGILDGSIKDFKEFAKQCARAFGATIHMRDEKFDAPFEPRKPSDYHTKKIDEANEQIRLAEILTDEAVVAIRKEELEKSKAYHMESIEKASANKKKLNEILNEAKQYEPPTPEHTGIKKFMIEQIEGTIDFDCKPDYHFEKLAEVREELKNITPENVRLDMRVKAYKDLTYHEKEQAAELDRCATANKWVEDYFASLENINATTQ